MTHTDHQMRVECFMKLAEQELPATPMIPTKEVRLLRAKLILEEALETIKALGILVSMNDLEISDVEFEDGGPVSLEEIADGCADISVVTIGTLSACGIHDQELLELVDKSNLAKFDIPKCPHHHLEMIHLHREIGNAFDPGLYECPERLCIEQAVGPYKRSDGKWIKPPNWKKPDIQGLLMQQAHDMKHNPFLKTYEEVEVDAKLKEAFEKIPDQPAILSELEQEIALEEPDIWIKEVELKKLKEEIVQEAVQRITKMWEEKYPVQRTWGGGKLPEITEVKDWSEVVAKIETQSIKDQITLTNDRIYLEIERCVRGDISWYAMKEFIAQELQLLVKAVIQEYVK